MSLNWNDSTLLEVDRSFHDRSGRREPKHAALERALFDWESEMQNSREFISSAMIQAKAHQLPQKGNLFFPESEEISTQISDGWRDIFKKRWYMKSFRLPGEAEDVDKSSINAHFHSIREKVF